MVRHGYGSKLLPGYTNIGAEQILRDPDYAIVRVDGMIPPGAREGDFFDVQRSALPGNKTTSLSGGHAVRVRPAPASAATRPTSRASTSSPRRAGRSSSTPPTPWPTPTPPGRSGQAKASLRSGMIMDGGR